MGLPPKRPHFPNWGLWDVDNLRISYLSDTRVRFSCAHLVINGERDIKDVCYTLLDKLRGKDFQVKVAAELLVYRDKMILRNEVIKQRRKKEDQLQSLL